jgi:alcohol dehydrogenase class IV
MAIESMRFISEYLNRALDEPQNINFRSKLSYASLLSGIAIGQTGLGLVHQMGFPLTLEMGVAHGRANGLLLPGACEWLLNRVPHQLDAVAKGLEITTAESIEAERVEKILLKIQTLISQVGVIPEFESKDIIDKKISDFTDRVSSHFGSEWNLSRKSIKKIYREALIQN